MINAYIGEDFDSVSIALVQSHPDQPHKHILRLGGDAGSLASWELLDTPGLVVEPTLRLSNEAARALLGALNTHFGGVEDTRALRRDYDDERVRVDKMITALIGVAAR